MEDKIKVLYICTDAKLGGSTQSLWQMIESLRDYITPIVLLPSKEDAFDFFIMRGITCIVHPFTILYDLKENRLMDVWRHPWRWHYIKWLRKDVGCVIHVLNILRGRKIDIVHSNTSPSDIGVRLSRLLHAKHIWHVREFCDLDFHFEIYRGFPRLRRLVNQATARIVISTAIKDHWQMPEENTWVINNAIRSKTDACYLPVKENYLLFCSYNLTEAKGARRAILAFALSKMAKDGYRLKMVGNCNEEYHASLIETAQQYGVLSNIDFIPRQTNVKPYFIHATAYIMASDFEGLGRVTGEAMFYGCPVIANATGGTLDLVKDGETGYLFYSVDECAQLIRKVCTEPQESLILHAQEFAINNLSQEVYGPKIMNVYKKVLGH